MGENLGPLPTEAVKGMLRQNRLQFTDFIWCKGNKKWHRIYEIDEFEMLMPPYPESGVPSDDVSGSEAAAEPAPKPKSEPRAEPKAESAPKPKAEPKLAPKTVPKTDPQFPHSRPRVGIEAQLVSKEHGAFVVVNVSEGGVFLKADDPIPVGTDVKFSLQSNKLPKILDMTGIVIRHSNPNDVFKGFAIEFTRVNPAHKRLLQDYVKSNTGEQ